MLKFAQSETSKPRYSKLHLKLSWKPCIKARGSEFAYMTIANALTQLKRNYLCISK